MRGTPIPVYRYFNHTFLTLRYRRYLPPILTGFSHSVRKKSNKFSRTKLQKTRRNCKLLYFGLFKIGVFHFWIAVSPIPTCVKIIHQTLLNNIIKASGSGKLFFLGCPCSHQAFSNVYFRFHW